MHERIRAEGTRRKLRIRVTVLVTSALSLSFALSGAEVASADGRGFDSPVLSRSGASNTPVGSSERYKSVTSGEWPASSGSGIAADQTGARFDSLPDRDAMALPQFGSESIVGADNRVQISPTTTNPNRRIAYLEFSTPDGTRSRCSGFLIGEWVLATAGHCVFNRNSSRGDIDWMPEESYTAFVAVDGDDLNYGYCGVSELMSVEGWTSSGLVEYDYGAVLLNCGIGAATGWFGLRWSSGSHTGDPVRVTGYPGEHTPPTMWTHNGDILGTANRRLFYGIDTTPGQSGAPVYGACSEGGPCALAVHAYGIPDSGAVTNSGTRVTEDVFDNYVDWAVKTG